MTSVREDPSRAAEYLASARATGDGRSIATVASRHIFRLYAHHYEELAEAVRGLPPELLREFPALYLVNPWIGVAVRSTRPLDIFLFDSYRGVEGEERATTLVLKMLSARHAGDLLASVTFAKQLDGLVRRGEAGDPGDPTGPLWYFHSQIGSTLLCAGSTSSALREFAITKQYGETFKNIDACRTTAGRAAIAYAVRGSIEDAERSLQAAVAYPEVSGAFRVNTVFTEQVAAAMIAVERMSSDAKERVSALDAMDGSEVVWPFLFLVRARYLMASQRPEEVLETARAARAAHLVQPGTLASDALASHRVLAHLALENVDAAHRIMESQERPGPFTRLAQLRLMIHTSDFGEANRIHRALSIASWLAPVHRAELLLLKACAESFEFDAVSSGIAERVADVASTGSFRRLFTSLSSRVLDDIAAQLWGRRRQALDAGTAGLRFASTLRPRPQLTPAELRVLSALLTTTSTSGVANVLGVSANTVKTQLRTLYRKLRVGTRTEAIAAGQRYAFLDDVLSAVPRTGSAGRPHG